MMRSAMNNENMSSFPTVRITRARAKVLGSSGGLTQLHPLEKQGNKVLRTNTKRAACGLDGCPKKRIVLKDVTNITRKNADANSNNAGRDEALFSCQLSKRNTEISLQTEAKVAQVQEEERESMVNGMNKIKTVDESEIVSVENLPHKITEFIDQKSLCTSVSTLEKTNPKDEQICKKEENSGDSSIIEIDTRHKDPKMCSPFVNDIYQNLYTAELNGRASLDYMESVQRYINRDMRAILIDWLVEVSDEYRMAPDTLYLTVNLIDRFLSHNHIEKQKLQLVGVTCMLIASKYEEIYAPQVEEFCFVTDNTYTKDEVVKMEIHVLNFLSFQLSVPTTKKFLRRFIHAAQASSEVPLAELEFLANYLAELTLMEYSFLKFLPSQIAASAVFLARWTLDQSHHPWNPTLGHYTRYKTSDLKNAVLELQELQLNTRGCPLKAIREKYKQPKFKCASTLCPSKPVQSFFK